MYFPLRLRGYFMTFVKFSLHQIACNLSCKCTNKCSLLCLFSFYWGMAPILPIIGVFSQSWGALLLTWWNKNPNLWLFLLILGIHCDIIQEIASPNVITIIRACASSSFPSLSYHHCDICINDVFNVVFIVVGLNILSVSIFFLKTRLKLLQPGKCFLILA